MSTLATKSIFQNIFHLNTVSCFMLGDSSYSGTVEHEICEKPIVPVVVVVMNFILYRQ